MIKGDNFFKEAEAKWELAGEGISRQITGYNTQLMVVKVKFETGAVGYEHDHFHSQGTVVASGKFKITIDGKSEILETGDGFFVPPNAKHGAECLDAGMLIDVFNPVREDFLK
ncbi:cupin domain-containing protein [Gramella sp. MAR_2010_147]|uniref:cupin domain-containing protein n=1 Tax=Gramella sp. MAR_2010_147 TaxID=1250205 RepID=UPI00087D288E|nr:cupin domain-containing protein [Gramella sp. MAR_2010_147]SDS66019.1 Cupin domain-containing protein [Gramella sp. MAR_2010_147]